MIKYIGCFFDYPALQASLERLPRQPLSRPVRAPHVTFAYRPHTIPTEAFGLPVTVMVTGYGCDGRNEALSVRFVGLPEILAPLAAQIPVPHITLSVCDTGKAVDSAHLTFAPVEPFLLTGLFGGMDEDDTLRS